MKIIVVEDNHIHVENIQKYFNTQKWDIQFLKTEYQFRDNLEEIISDPPDIFVIDIMLRWTDPSPDMVPPPERIQKEGIYRAGFRCQAELQKHPQTEKIPIILFSVLGKQELHKDLEGLPDHVKFMEKTDNQSKLSQTIKEMTRK